MYLSHSIDHSNESLWLVVQRDQRHRAFELPPKGGKSVVFGASAEANVTLQGAAPIALRVERDQNGIWLIPGYAEPGLFVDGQPLLVRRKMLTRAVVETPNVRLILEVRDTPPTVRGGSNRNENPPQFEANGTKTEELNAYEIRMALEQYATESHRPTGDTTTYDAAVVGQWVASPVEPLPPIDSRVAAVKPASTTLPFMARLGILAKQKPIHVIAGAVFGSLFLVVFMVGVKSLVSAGSQSKTEPPATRAVPRAELPKPAEPVIAKETAPQVNVAAAVDEGIDSNVPIAANHLFAGRFAEAEQAYRELAVKHPTHERYATLAKVLARRNGAECRANADAKKSCPQVKP